MVNVFFGNTNILEPCSSKSIDISFSVILWFLLGYVRLQFQIGQYLSVFVQDGNIWGKNLWQHWVFHQDK